jgi:hypothetical protein
MDADVNRSFARGWVARFSPEQPLVVPPAVFAAMKESGQFDDLMDRVIENRRLPEAPQ